MPRPCHILATLGLLCGTALLALWARSHRVGDACSYVKVWNDPDGGPGSNRRYFYASSAAGRLGIQLLFEHRDAAEFSYVDDPCSGTPGLTHLSFKLTGPDRSTYALDPASTFRWEGDRDNRYVTIVLPHWSLASAFALAILPASIHFVRRRSRLRNGRCLKCGYDLRSSPLRCPECGQATGATR